MRGLFQEYEDIFSQGEDDLGCTPLLQQTIETEGPPLRQPHRRQNPAVRREGMAQVQQMLSTGVIRPSNSPWASPVSRSRKRMAASASVSIFDSSTQQRSKTPIPSHGSTISSMLFMAARWFSTLDLKSGYWQVPSRNRTRRRPLSAQAADNSLSSIKYPSVSATLLPPSSRLMDRVLAGLHWETCLFYLDDIIVFTATWEEHLAHLRQVFGGSDRQN